MTTEQGAFAGKTVLVTGAAGGIGAETVRAFASAGASVAAVDHDHPGTAATAAQIGEELQQRGRVRGFPADVGDPDAVENVVVSIERTLGPIDVLVNAAGVLRTGSVVDTAPEDWTALFHANTTGVFTVSRAVARRMIPRASGNIVTVSSNAGGVPRKNMAAYAASKAAATMFTKSLGLELAEYGIRCNVVAPGSTDTAMLRGMGSDPNALSDQIIAGDPTEFKVGIPLGKLGQPRDVANTVLFLVSPQANHITMQEFYVDGGAALR